MTRSRIAALCALAFIVLFCFSGVTASTTVKDTTAVIDMSLPKVLFSLSSASTLLIPLSIFSMVGAAIALLCNRRSVGMLFSLISFACFGLFMVFFAMEKSNSALYTPLSEQLKELGVKFKKRDVKAISASFDLLSYLTLAMAGVTVVLALPPLKTEADRRILRRELLPYAYISPHLFNEPVFIGTENFRTLLFDSSNTYYKQLRNGLWNTIKFVIYSVPFCILVPLSLALALQTRFRGSKFYQAIYYLPSLLSISTVTLSWRYVFAIDYGIVNKFLGSTHNWFTPPYSWIMLVVVTVWWCTGGTMVIYQSALASIPQDQYEAAAVDGAGAWAKFRHITMPGMRYPLMYTLVMAVVAQFNIYGQPSIMTGFANQEANAVLLMYVYENSVKKQVAGMSAAMALILGLCIMVVSFIQMKVMRANTPE